MKKATFVHPPNLLAAAADLPGGIRVADALEKAAENLEHIREPSLEAMDGYLAELESICAGAGARPPEATARRIYDLSNDVVSIAGVFNLSELGSAAYSLCELVDCFLSLNRWNESAVVVHLSAFRFLRQTSIGADHASVLEGLNRLVLQASTIAT